MAYNPYGGNPYGGYNPYPGVGRGAPGYAAPPGMHVPGMQQPMNAAPMPRAAGLPASFQPPPNINFNAPVIRLGGASGSSSLPARPNVPTGPSGWRDDAPLSAGGPMRSDFGRHDRNGGDLPGGRGSVGGGVRETIYTVVRPNSDEKLRTIFVYDIPESLRDGQKLEHLMGLVGRLRRWDCEKIKDGSTEGALIAFAQYEDADSFVSALKLLEGVEVPLKKQKPKAKDEEGDKAKKEDGGEGEKDEKDDKGEKSEKEGEKEGEVEFASVEKVPLKFAYDSVAMEFVAKHEDNQDEEEAALAKTKQDACAKALQAAIRDLFYPTQGGGRGDGDVTMTDVGGLGRDGMEVLTIPLAQDDELADIPAEMREMVATEIASFRERSIKRDMERMKREQELEVMERRRNDEQERARVVAGGGGGHVDLGPASSINNIPLGPRSGVSGAVPRGAGAARAPEFVSGGMNGHDSKRDRDSSPETEMSDGEQHRREVRRKAADEEALFREGERKWQARERQKDAALDREKGRDRKATDSTTRHREEQLERERTWDDEREAARKTSLYYREHATWLRGRAQDRMDEESRDAADRRAEREEMRRQAVEMETARGMADSFLEQQAAGMSLHGKPAKEAAAAAPATPVTPTAPAAPQRVTISFGAAAQRAQAQRAGPVRRTVAEVEGLLDDEEQDETTKRQLVPIKFEPMAPSASMTDAELAQAVRALAQEIPTDREGLWRWPVHWECLDEGILREKLRPFVEKKVVEYLGVQEQFLVDVVLDHLRKHEQAKALVEELQEALDEAEDLVKKLWRMVIFYTESEKRGLPA